MDFDEEREGLLRGETCDSSFWNHGGPCHKNNAFSSNDGVLPSLPFEVQMKAEYTCGGLNERDGVGFLQPTLFFPPSEEKGHAIFSI